MGYRRSVPVLSLVFDDPEFKNPAEGDPLQVKIKTVSLAKYNEIFNPFAQEYLDELQTEFDKDDPKGSVEKLFKEMKANDPIKKLYGSFAENLVYWNLEDEDGNPIPTNWDGVLQVDMFLLKMLIRTWRTALVGVDSPLPPGSTDGETAPKVDQLELSMPMESL